LEALNWLDSRRALRFQVAPSSDTGGDETASWAHVQTRNAARTRSETFDVRRVPARPLTDPIRPTPTLPSFEPRSRPGRETVCYHF
jgi:hypothetical protein